MTRMTGQRRGQQETQETTMTMTTKAGNGSAPKRKRQWPEQDDGTE